MPAKPGNTNALKHGLYATRFTPQEKKHLANMPDNSVIQEIALLRTVIDRATDALYTAEKALNTLTTIDKDGNTVFDSQAAQGYAKLLNSHTTAITALNTLIRTHALLTGEIDPIRDALDQALLEFDFFDPATAPEYIHVNKSQQQRDNESNQGNRERQ